MRPPSAATSDGSSRATSCATSAANALNSSFLATKSVSQLTSTIAPTLPSGETSRPMTPSAATRSAALDALAPLLMRSSSSAFAMSPAVSASAFLHSIMPRPVRPRSSITMLAAISAMLFAPVCCRCRASAILPAASALKKRGRSPFWTMTSGRGLVRRHFDELLGLHDFLDNLTPALEDRVDDTDDRNRKLAGFGHRDLLIADIDDEQRVRQRVHFLDAAQASGELFHLALQRQRFALAHFLERAVLRHRLEILQALDRNLHRLEVGKHPAEPPVVDIGHAGALRFFRDDFPRLALGADKQDSAAVGGQLADVLQRLLVHLHHLFEVDDVNLVAGAEDEIRHLRVPVPCLVAEMHSGLQHLTHCDRHHYTPFQG